MHRIPSLRSRWLTLRRAWMLSHVVFALLMWLTFLVHDTTAGTILLAFMWIAEWPPAQSTSAGTATSSTNPP